MKFSFTGENGEDKSTELKDFACLIGLEAIAHDRYSALLLLQLFASYKSRRLNPSKVIHEITSLESTDVISNTKPPEPFNGSALRGLWHKHYLPDGIRAMAINLRNGILKDGLPWFEKRVNDAVASGEEHFVTEEDIKTITYDAVSQNWTRRSTAKELTGEWVIYAKHEGLNYYLCLGEHSTGDQNLRANIEAICFTEFPFLPALMATQ